MASPIITEDDGGLDWKPLGAEPPEQFLDRLGLTMPTLNALLRSYDIKPLELPEAPRPMQYSPRLPAQIDRTTYASCAETLSVVGVQPEIGTSGTQMQSGQLTDPTARFAPMMVRGAYGGWGLYDEVWRGDPLVADSIQTHTEMLVSADWSIQMPKEVPRGKKRLETFCKVHWGALQSLDGGGWSNFLDHACAMLGHGFEPFELVWRELSNSWTTWQKIAWRSPGTVARWIMDPWQRDHLATEFQAMTDAGGLHYYLAASGPMSFHHKMMVVNIGALGNNFEGVSPLRSCLVYIKLKQLLVQIAGLSAELYGVPISTLRRDPAWAVARDGQGATSKRDLKDVFRSILRLRAVDGPRLVLPDGTLYEVHGPTGTMPQLLDLIGYCDRQVLLRYGLEGSMLGTEGNGARSLGDTMDRQARRARHYYARLIARPFNDLLIKMCREQVGEMPEYPQLVCNFGDDDEEVSAWVTSMTELFGGPIQTWPASVQEQAVAKMKLPPQTLAELKASRSQLPQATLPTQQPQPQPKEANDAPQQ